MSKCWAAMGRFSITWCCFLGFHSKLSAFPCVFQLGCSLCCGEQRGFWNIFGVRWWEVLENPACHFSTEEPWFRIQVAQRWQEGQQAGVGGGWARPTAAEQGLPWQLVASRPPLGEGYNVKVLNRLTFLKELKTTPVRRLVTSGLLKWGIPWRASLVLSGFICIDLGMITGHLSPVSQLIKWPQILV